VLQQVLGAGVETTPSLGGFAQRSKEALERCRLDLTERTKNEPTYRLHKDLLQW
jgi:hypothetical protein